MSDSRQLDRMHFSIGGFEGSNIELELKNGILCHRTWEGGAEPENAQQLQPSSKEWEHFWQEIERIGVWDWQPSYITPDVLDGTSWSLKLHHAGRTIETGGDNGYPGGDGTDYSRSSPFALFLRAMKRLSGVKRLQ